MKISDLFKTKKAVFSFEIFPPKKVSSLENIFETIDEMALLAPDYISVTYGAGGSLRDMFTVEIAEYIKSKNIEPLAHLTCINSTKKETEIILNNLKDKNIENILALRGDRNPDIKPVNNFDYAKDLINYAKEKYDFNIAAACYPEVHPESESGDLDLDYLKEKVESGASHLISQLFFDNNDFYNFMYQLREKGITIPVQAGIMPVINKNNIKRIVATCGASLPKKFVRIISRYENNPEALFEAGTAYATEQIIDLLSNNVQGIHLYTMNKINVATKIKSNVDNILKSINQEG